MNTYILTPDAFTFALAVMVAVTTTVALAVRLADDLRSTRRKDSDAMKRNLRNAAQWDKFKGRLNPARIGIEKP